MWKNVLGLDANGISDYYFRDSFDQSSTESGLTNVAENRIGHRFITTSDNIPFPFQHNNSAVAIQQNATNNAKTIKQFSIIQAFVPSFIFVVIILIFGTIFILESESDIVAPFRNMPEMISLKHQYYQPLKDFFSKQFSN